ncbi:unnamed protein product [Caenorhabditis sp. 36 PRJEB53466]|nr:unnamed protein product [Caenorhabditis sp. 36 PRJEB53466]
MSSFSRRIIAISAIIIVHVSVQSSAATDALHHHHHHEDPLPKGASCPQSIFRPSLVFYLTPFVFAFLIFHKSITSDIRLIYGN